MKKYDFDKVIDRHGTSAIKYDDLQQWFGEKDLLPLWIADMDFAVCPAISDALAKRISHPIYGYSSPSESYWKSITDWLRRRHDFEVSREEITFVPGVVKGIAFAINYFTRGGDKVVIQPPVYHPFRMVIEGNGRQVVENPLLKTDDGYEMDLRGLEKILVEEHPKMMIVCNPHNPIGIQWSEETLREVARLCCRHGVTVVSDEIHGDLMLHGRKHYPFPSVSDDARAICVMLGAPSKTFNIPGVVSSWCVVKDPEMRRPFYQWLASNEFDASTFMATIATEAAYTQGEEWLDEALEYIEANIEATDKFLSERLPEVKLVKPQASFLVWFDFRGLGLTHDQLIDLVVHHAGLALNDGGMFGKQGDGFMRVNVATPRKVLIEALERLEKAIHE